MADDDDLFEVPGLAWSLLGYSVVKQELDPSPAEWLGFQRLFLGLHLLAAVVFEFESVFEFYVQSLGMSSTRIF